MNQGTVNEVKSDIITEDNQLDKQSDIDKADIKLPL